MISELAGIAKIGLALMIAFVGTRFDSSCTIRIGLTGLASTMACCSMVSHQDATFFSTCWRQDRFSLYSSMGTSDRNVAAASPTRLSSVGYRMPIMVASRSTCTALTPPNGGMNCVYGKLEPTISRVSQSRISS